MYYSTKHYGHNIGLSAVFRQPNADHSHCHLLHGYSLAFTFKFGCHELDNKNWAVDFGGLKDLKRWLEDSFDHKTVVDKADPMRSELEHLEEIGLAEIRIFDGVGAEKFAEHAFNFAQKLINDKSDGRCWVESCEVAEHGANSAIYQRDLNS
jgi:6-pyruvoyltetrahydropterin/6-carboxytetrahydropterin synthase|tara:strand:+ start:360 stop:815 length:456 start_codon:yes stop_codon:yes gene_type:complete